MRCTCGRTYELSVDGEHAVMVDDNRRGESVLSIGRDDNGQFICVHPTGAHTFDMPPWVHPVWAKMIGDAILVEDESPSHAEDVVV